MNTGKMMALCAAMQEAAENKNTFDRVMAKKEKIEELLELDERVLVLEAFKLYAEREKSKITKIMELVKDEEEFDND